MSARTLRLAFFGTPPFAVPTLERLRAGRHPVVVVVTQPDRPRGRGRRVVPSPVASVAERTGLPLLRPERVAEPGFADALRAYAIDLGVVVAFGQFIPRRVRTLPALGFLINAHASLLPKYRGATPIPHTILAGETETGICVMRIEREMDAGPVAVVRRTAIGAEETAGELEERLAGVAAEAVEEAIERAAAGSLVWTPQDERGVSHAPKLRPEDAILDFGEPAEALVRRVRALAPRPGAFTTWRGERIRILAARALPGPTGVPPGRVRREGEMPLWIATGRGWLAPGVLQREGGRPLEVDAFLRGRVIPDGARLGAAPSTARLER